MSPCLVGLDISPLRIGWAVVDLEDGCPLKVGTVHVNLPHNSWSAEQLAYDLIRGPGLYIYDKDVALIYIEQPMSQFVKAQYQAGMAVGMVSTIIQRDWEKGPPQFLAPSEWRKLCGLAGNCKKEVVFDHATAQLEGTGLTLDGSQDAADALCVAIAGQRRNQEIWELANGGIGVSSHDP